MYKLALSALALLLGASNMLFGINELIFVGNGVSGSLTNELKYASDKRQYVLNPTPDNRWRIGTGESGGTYSVTLPDDYSLLGVLWVYAWKDCNITIDGRGADFRQWAREDDGDVNNVGLPLAINNNTYGNYQVELSKTGSKHSSFRFVDTLQTIVRNMAEGLFLWNLNQGLFSFAEHSSPGTLVLGGSSQKPDRLFEMNLNNVTSYFPQTEFRCYNTNNTVAVNGGRLELRGYVKFDCNSRGRSGMHEFRVSQGAQCEQVSGGLYIGSASDAANPERIVRMVFDGDGTRYTPPADYSEQILRGRGELHVTGGASFTAGEFVRVGNADSNSIKDAPKIKVSGPGSYFDASKTRLVRFSRDGSLEVADGAKAVFSADIKFGETYAGSNTVVVSGAGSELLFTNYVSVAESGETTVTPPTIVLGYGDNSTCVVSVAEGAYLGFSKGVKGILRLGQNRNTYGVLNVAGGKVVLPATSSTYVGYSSPAEIAVFSGELIVSNEMYFSALEHPETPFKSVLRQTGGSILLYNGINLDYMAKDNFTGEVFLEGGTLQTDSISGGNSAFSVVHANGGTLLPRQNRTSPEWSFCQSVDLFEIGPKGLTIDTAGKNIAVRQHFTNYVGESGLFVKKGAGTLTLSVDRLDVARAVVENGSFVAGVDNSIYKAAFAVTNAATLSMVGGCTDLTVASLSVTNATLAFDPGDKLTVEGGLSLSGLTLVFSALPSDSDSAALLNLTVKGVFDDVSRRELRCAVLRALPQSGRHFSVSISDDAISGCVGISVVYAGDAEMLDPASATTYLGGEWSAATTWDAGVPDSGKTAVFGPAGATQRNVSLPDCADVGAVAFSGDGYELSGGALAFNAAKGAARISVNEGSHKISSPISANIELDADVAYGSSLSIAGYGSLYALRKNGAGWLELTGTSETGLGKITYGEGSLRFPQQQNGGTLRLDSLVVRNDGLPAVVVTEADTALSHLDVSGALIKRGTGKLILEAGNLLGQKSELTTHRTNNHGAPLSGSSVHGFDADGAAPAGGYSGLTIAEGEFVVKGENALPVVKSTGACVIGMNATNLTGHARFTIDGATLDNNIVAGTYFYVGYGAAHSISYGKIQCNPTLSIINGGVLKVDTLKTGEGFYGYYDTHPTVAMTNGTLYALYPSLTSLPNHITYPKWFVKDSRVLAHPVEDRLIEVHGGVDAYFDNSYIGPGTPSDTEMSNVKMPMGNKDWSYADPTGRVAFVNGTIVNVSEFKNYLQIQKHFQYVWDNAEWRYGGGDYQFEMAKFNPEKFEFTMKGRGIILRPDAGATFTVGFPFTGEGGVVNAGAGTLKFASGAYGIGGVCELVSGGIADLSEAGVVDSAAFKGNGTVRGVAAKAMRIHVEADDEWRVSEILTLDGCSPERITVDFGRVGTVASVVVPKGVKVCKSVQRLAPGLFRAANTGLSNVAAVFSQDAEGTVWMDFKKIGFALLVR